MPVKYIYCSKTMLPRDMPHFLRMKGAVGFVVALILVGLLSILINIPNHDPASLFEGGLFSFATPFAYGGFGLFIFVLLLSVLVIGFFGAIVGGILQKKGCGTKSIILASAIFLILLFIMDWRLWASFQRNRFANMSTSQCESQSFIWRGYCLSQNRAPNGGKDECNNMPEDSLTEGEARRRCFSRLSAAKKDPDQCPSKYINICLEAIAVETKDPSWCEKIIITPELLNPNNPPDLLKTMKNDCYNRVAWGQ